MRDPEFLAEQQIPARNPEQPAQTFTPRMRPITINARPVEHITERTYIEGYPAQQEVPGRDTGPIVLPPIINVHVAHPPAMQAMSERIIVYEQRPPISDQRPQRERTSDRDSAPTNKPVYTPIPPRPLAPRPGPENRTPVNPAIEVQPSTPETPVSPVANSPVSEQPVRSQGSENFNGPVKEKINGPLKFSPPEVASQAEPRKKLQHKKRNPGRQRKYHQTIALLEDTHNGDTNQFDRLDPQMQRYYKREYADYFGRDSKRAAEQRLTNRTKAQRTKRESERRRIAEISRDHTNTAI